MALIGDPDPDLEPDLDLDPDFDLEREPRDLGEPDLERGEPDLERELDRDLGIQQFRKLIIGQRELHDQSELMTQEGAINFSLGNFP